MSFLLPEEDRVSRIHNGIGEMLDHILVSHRLIPPSNPPSLRTASGEDLPTVTNDPGDRSDELEPDHALVIATFEMGNGH